MWRYVFVVVVVVVVVLLFLLLWVCYFTKVSKFNARTTLTYLFY